MVRRRNYRKWLWWGAGLVLIALVVIIAVVINQNNTGNESNEAQNQDNSSAVEKQEVEQGGLTDEEKFAEEEVEKKKVVQYEGEDPNEAEDLSGVVTYADVVDGMLMVRVSIDQYLTEGTCELTLAQGGATIYNSIARIIGDVSTATCEGFDVSVEQLGGGNTEIIINLNANERRGVIRGEVEI